MTFCQDIYDMLCRRHSGSNIYVIGDQHFYHQNIIKYSRGQFSSVQEMNNYIRKCHNEVVGVNDIVIFLGDFCLNNPGIREFAETLNGHKYLILGNHDSRSLEKRYPSLGFEGVYVTPVKINDKYFSHEPLIKGSRTDLTFQGILSEFVNSDGVNYHGHIHDKNFSISSAYVNASCEAIDYKPILVGKTPKSFIDKTKPLFINSPYFNQVIENIRKSVGLESRLLFDDYIYSLMLESLSKYKSQSFIQGSFGLYKKYGYMSRFSDLDITVLYNQSKSKNKNYAVLKSISDYIYEYMKRIDGVNLEFIKRYSTLRIFSLTLAKPNSLFSNSYSDMNLDLLSSFRSSDFIELGGVTTIQRYLSRDNASLLEEYAFPNFSVQSLKPAGDVSNLILQILFQKDNPDKQITALKKLHYLYKHVLNNNEIENLLDTFIRFFLRNISLLSMWGRTGEIDYIKNCKNQLSSLMEPFVKVLPNYLLEQIYDVLMNPNSLFLSVYDEIVSIPTEEMSKGCSRLMKSIK